MRALTLLAVLVLAAASLPLAAAQVGPRSGVTTPVSDYRDLRDEPNVQEAGRIPYPASWRGEPLDGTAYPADSNGVADAKEGANVKILNAILTHYCPVQQDCTHYRLLMPFTGKEFMVTPYKRFVALHGWWSDDNRDGWLQDRQIEGASPSTILADPSAAAEGRYYLDPAVASAEESGDEFVGLDGVVIVSYVSPKPVNESAEERYKADNVYVTGGAPGLYWSSLLLGGELHYYDQSLLRTTVVETISAPQQSPGGARNYEASSESLVDVDLYRSLDPTAEALWTSILPEGHFWIQNLVLHPVLDAYYDLQRDGLDSLRPVVGPVRAQIQAREEYENGQRDDYASEAHSWWNAWVGFPQTYRPTGSTYDHAHNCRGGYAPVALPGTCHLGVGGEYRPYVMISGFGVFGFWHDVDADGWIGSPKIFNGCPDAYACGTNMDPNDWGEVTQEGRLEFEPYCVTYAGNHIPVPLHVTPMTPGASWGAGVYVVRDDDATAPNNPYDDALDDVTSLRAERYVMSGTITLMLHCKRYSTVTGEHPSHEAILLPGAQIGFDLHVASQPILVDHAVLGVSYAETIEDVDIVRGWHV